jgi:hypothetical protein
MSEKPGAPDKRETSYNSPVYNTPSNAKSSVIDSIKKSIKGVKKYVMKKVKTEDKKVKKDKTSKKDTKTELLEKIEEIETTKLDNLEREMIQLVKDTEVGEPVAGANIDVLKVFDDVLKNFTIELHNVLGFKEQTVAIIEQQYPEESSVQPVAIQTPINKEQSNLTELNSLLKALANNMYNSENQRDLLFTENTSVGKQTSYSIRHKYYGISINYTTLKEFFDKISSRADFVMNICWMISCPEKLTKKLKELKNKHTKNMEDYSEILKLFKDTVKVYLDIEQNKSVPRKYPSTTGALAVASERTSDIPLELSMLLPTTVSGGKKNKRKPRKAPKPRKEPKPRKASKPRKEPKPRKAK